MVLPILPLLPLLGGLAQATSGAAADDGDMPPARFAEPVLLTAGAQPLGRGILYPSPHLRDVDGDGQREIVFGDLWGMLHVAEKLPGDDPLAWSEPTPLKRADGEILKFHNW